MRKALDRELTLKYVEYMINGHENTDADVSVSRPYKGSFERASLVTSEKEDKSRYYSPSSRRWVKR